MAGALFMTYKVCSMLFYLRLLSLYLKGVFNKESDNKQVLAHSSIKLRVMPTETNAFLLMDNSRYNRALDLGKFDALLRFNKFKQIIKQRWIPLTICVDMSIFKPIRLFTQFRLVSRVAYWERGYVYMEHKFLVENVLHATALSKSCFLKGKQLVTDKELGQLYGISSPLKPETISKWDELGQTKKNHLLAETSTANIQ